MKKQRIPRLKNSMQFLREHGLNVKYVLDIGVAVGTPWLMQSFPSAMHRLIEPDPTWNSDIHANYEDHSYEITNVALGAEIQEEIELTLVRAGKDSWAETYEYTSSMTTLDNLYIVPDQHSVLKLDVDGLELDILAGGQDTLPRFDILIIEAKLDKIADTIQAIPDCFELWDMANMDYDWGNLAQVDLVFKNRFLELNEPTEYSEYQSFRQGAVYL